MLPKSLRDNNTNNGTDKKKPTSQINMKKLVIRKKPLNSLWIEPEPLSSVSLEFDLELFVLTLNKSISKITPIPGKISPKSTNKPSIKVTVPTKSGTSLASSE
jgi:hypothetical protein